MRYGLLLTLLPLAACANDGYHWRKVADVDRVTVIVHEVSSEKLRGLQGSIDFHTAAYREGRGFAILYRNKSTGRYSCDVFVLNEDDSKTLEHELRHCHGWSHD